VKQLCRHCILFDVSRTLDKRGRILRNRVGKCLWKSTEDYPTSVGHCSSRPQAQYTSPDDGANCLCFKAKTEVNDRG
jgi:hypothetical protein